MSFSTSHSAPIKLEGFDIPSSSQSSSHPHHVNPGYIDPNMLFSQYGTSKPSSSSSFGATGGGGGGFSALDLGDFDGSFADLMPPSSAANTQNQAAYYSSPNHANNFNLPAFDNFAYNSRPSPSSNTNSNTNTNTNGIDFAASFAAQQHLQQQQQQQAASSLPHYLSSTSSASRSPIPAFASSPRDARSPSIPTPQTDVFGNPLPSQDSPNNQEYGSYSSVGESLPGADGPPPTNTKKKRTTSTERSSRSTGVGKAPNSSTRSRSARRGTAQSPLSPPSHGAQAIIIPSSSVPTQHAMSMPAYGGGGTWFASAQAIAFAQKEPQTPNENGWKPSHEQNGPGLVPASAPVAGSKKVSMKPLDDVLEDPGQKQAALLTEKRRKRRESHNAVERRRRDNINDRITELASLLPECLLEGVNGDDVGASPAGMMSPAPGLIPLPAMGTSPATNNSMGVSANSAAQAGQGKPNKGIILAKSVEYIRYLQQLVELHTHRNAELERLVGTSSQSDSEAPSPDARIMAMVGTNLSDPNFNEKYFNAAANGMFANAGGGWDMMGLMGDVKLKEEEEDDDSLMRD